MTQRATKEVFLYGTKIVSASIQTEIEVIQNPNNRSMESILSELSHNTTIGSDLYTHEEITYEGREGVLVKLSLQGEGWFDWEDCGLDDQSLYLGDFQ